MDGDKHAPRCSCFSSAVHATYTIGNDDVFFGRTCLAHLPERTYQHHSRYSDLMSAIPALHGNASVIFMPPIFNRYSSCFLYPLSIIFLISLCTQFIQERMVRIKFTEFVECPLKIQFAFFDFAGLFQAVGILIEIHTVYPARIDSNFKSRNSKIIAFYIISGLCCPKSKCNDTIKITTSTRRKEIPPNTDRINFDLSLKGGGDSKKGLLKVPGC